MSVTVLGPKKITLRVAARPAVLNGTVQYVHVQATEQVAWTINHNLGYRPAVQILDAAGQPVVGSVAHLSVNQLQISFSIPLAGSARCF